MNIRVEYDGKWPNLCRGHLFVIINDYTWDFGIGSITSGGITNWRKNNVTEGNWTVNNWPENFPEKYKNKTIKKINNDIPWGCCGGCI